MLGSYGTVHKAVSFRTSRGESFDWLVCVSTGSFNYLRKEFLRMSVDDPEVTTVTSKGQITIPSRLRDQFGLEKGTKLMVVPTDYGLVLKKIELPSVTEFQERVAERAEDNELSLGDVNQLVHAAREIDE